MKGIKIDIKKEEIDVPFGDYYEEQHQRIEAIFKEGEFPTAQDFSAKMFIYRPMKIHNEETGNDTIYFVHTDDSRLFRDLIHVSEGFIQKLIDEAINKCKNKFYYFDTPRIENGIKTQIKHLPWYKRLFNKF